MAKNTDELLTRIDDLLTAGGYADYASTGHDDPEDWEREAMRWRPDAPRTAAPPPALEYHGDALDLITMSHPAVAAARADLHRRMRTELGRTLCELLYGGQDHPATVSGSAYPGDPTRRVPGFRGGRVARVIYDEVTSWADDVALD